MGEVIMVPSAFKLPGAEPNALSLVPRINFETASGFGSVFA
jgi:hypothetical protein